MKKLLLTLLMVSSMSAFATPLETNDRQTVGDILIPWAERVKTSPEESIVIMPPKFFEVMAKKSGMSVDEFKKAMLDVVNASMEVIEIQSYSYDLDHADAAKSSNGRDYAFIPQVTKMKRKDGGSEMTMNGYMLGIKDDDGKWYFLNWEPQYAPIVAEMYPDLQGVQEPKQ